MDNSESSLSSHIPPNLLVSPNSKKVIRTSLKASTADAVFATVFSVATHGILLSNFLVELDASPFIFGILSSIPVLINLAQPLGAYLSERGTSRLRYSIWTYGTSRILWLILFIGILTLNSGYINQHQLVTLTLIIVSMSHFFGCLGSASWLSWLAAIIPRRLRGRYFGIRNSAASLTNLICVPLAGLVISSWPGGSFQGYGVVLLVGILFGFLSIVCQCFKVDINPRMLNSGLSKDFSQTTAVELNTTISHTTGSKSDSPQSVDTNFWQSLLKDTNFLIFLSYTCLWVLSLSLSVPFFNLYLLDTLKLNIKWVTIYSSLHAGANLLMMMFWGKLADKIGSRPILILAGILLSVSTPIWLRIQVNQMSIWLWLPLLHMFIGSMGAAIDLCINNLQLGVSPTKNQAVYFSIIAAVGGLSGALGTIIGGFLAQTSALGGLPGLFMLAAVFRLIAVVPLLFLQEPGKQSLTQLVQSFWQVRTKLARMTLPS